MARGRPRIPLEVLKIRGALRAGEHDSRLNEPQAVGEPIKPAGMDATASMLWDRLLPRLMEMRVVKEIDTEALVAACEMWSLYCAAKKKAFVDPCDKNIRAAVVAYWTAFDKASGRLGMNPADRARLNVPPEVIQKDGIQEFARKRG